MNARQRYQQQAQLEAGLQIDPQIQALASLLSDKRAQYLQTRSLNASSARGIANAAQQAIPQIQQFYGGDAAHPAQGSVLAAALMGQAGPERDAFVRRMAADQTRTTSDLAQQASRASQAQVYGNQQARSQYLSDKGKIVQDAYALQGQKGALTATTLGRLLDGMRQRQVTTRGQDKTAASAAAGRKIERDRLAETQRHNQVTETTAKTPTASDVFQQKYGVPLNTPEAHGAAKDNVDERLTDAGALKKAGLSRAEAAAVLVHGRKGGPVLVVNPKTNKVGPKMVPQPDGTVKPETKSDWKSWGNNLWTGIALDLAYDGHVSRAHAAQLHKRGYSVKQIGLLGVLPPNPAAVVTAGVQAASGIG